jgi:hypothetical protein
VPLLHIEYTVGLAWGPNPPDGATDVPADASLAWMASKYAATHDVYLGTALADVNNAGQDAAMGVLASQGQSETQYDPAEPLAYGQTYYWRIDEVNAAPDSTVRKGNVWSFTVEPFAYPIANVIATASGSQPDMGPENTVNGSGLNAADQHSTELTDMWTSEGVQPNWIQYEFDKVYKLNELWVWNSNQLIETFLGFGAKDVTLEYSVDGATWSVLEGVPEFAKATAKATYTANTTVDLGGVMARFVKLTIHRNWGGGMPQTGLSEVRFFYVPVQARLPEPADEAAGISIDAELRWRPGREAESHEVYLGTEENALTLADTVTGTSYSPLALDLATTYYWKVSEVGGAGPYEGDAWSFTTSDHVVVEDFEAYTDDEGGQIYKAWVDGYEDPANGSQVGHLTSPFAERTIVHDGRQAMPLFYSNTNGATFSEGTYTFDTPQDWTRAGIATLALWFRGAAGNAGQLYVKINNTKVPYDGTAGTLALAGWQPWSIDLTALSANLKSVRTLTIGVEGNGASGTLYFDDVALYRSAFEPVLEWKVTSSTDDNEEFANGGAMAGADSSDLELGYEGDLDPTNLQIVGCRWVGIAVPKGATITEAWVQFSADDVDNAYHTPAVSVIIEGELSAGPLTFSNTGGELSSRKKTTANVVWNIPTWTTVHAKGPDERTPDISKIIQEIVNQPDWAGEAIVLTFRDNPAKPSQGCREAEAFDGGADEAPALHIRYE